MTEGHSNVVESVREAQAEAGETVVVEALEEKLGTETPAGEYAPKNVQDGVEFEESVEIVHGEMLKFGIDDVAAVRAKLIAQNDKFQALKEACIACDFLEHDVQDILPKMLEANPELGGKLMFGLIDELEQYKNALGHLLASGTLLELIVEHKDCLPTVS